MKNSKRKINWIWIIYLSVGLVIGGVAAITYISISKLMNNDPKGITFKRSKGKNTWFGFDGKEIMDDDHSNKLKAIKFKVVNNGSETNDIDNDVLKMVAKKFIERGVFGPELGSLKSVAFNDSNLISNEESDANGIYIPATKEIGISTKHINDMLSRFFSSKSAAYKEMKSEALFQVLYHEYGHHIFASYAESPYTGNVKTIYEKDWDKTEKKLNIKESKWNELFLEKFMNIFTYDDPKSLPIDYNSNNLQTEDNFTVGYKFSAYDLFNEININKNPPKINGTSDPNSINWDDEYLNLSAQMIDNFKNNNIDLNKYKMSIKDTYSYLYSAEELVTRKLLLASAPFSLRADYASNYKGVYPYDLVSDFSNFATKPAEIKWNDYANGSQIYMNDYLFTKKGNRAEKYMKLIDDTMGHKQNNNISFIWNLNNTFVANTNGGITVAPSKENGGPRSNPNQIKFGGYTSKPYNYVGYMDGNKFVPFKIKTYKYKIGYKNSLLSGFDDVNSKDLREKIKYYKKDENGNNVLDKSLSSLPYSYYLEPWVNANDIQGQVLYFSDDKIGTNKQIMSGVRSNDQGGTTSFSKWAKWELNEPDSLIWKVEKGKETKDNEVGFMIKNAGYFEDAASYLENK